MSQTWQNAHARGVAGVGQRSGVATLALPAQGAYAEAAAESCDAVTALNQTPQPLMEASHANG